MWTVMTLNAPRPVGPYSQAIVCDKLVFCSGQIGIDPISGELVGDEVAAQAERAILNLKAVLAEADCELADVIRVTLLLKHIDDLPKVNEVFSNHFLGSKPSRTTACVDSLPCGALVEIDAIAALR